MHLIANTVQAFFSTGGVLCWVSEQAKYLFSIAIVRILYQQTERLLKLANNIRVRIVGILVITLLRFSFTSHEVLSGMTPFEWEAFASNLGFSFITALLLWEATRAIVMYFHR